MLESPQLPFLMFTLEIPQKFAAHVLDLNLWLFLLFEPLSQTELFSN